MQPTKSDVGVETMAWEVQVDGVVPIMFDRYAGDNNTKLENHQKMYYLEDKKTLAMPAINITSFLSGQNTMSAPKRLLEPKKYKAVANACLSYVSVEPDFIPFMRDGKPIEFGEFRGDKDTKSGVFVHRSVARLKDGIPNPKTRPTLPLPWSLAFTLTMWQNNEIKEPTLKKLFVEGGLALGWGTFRGVFGKFKVTRWEKI